MLLLSTYANYDGDFWIDVSGADDGCVDISGSTSLRACRHGDSLHNTTAPRLTLNTDHSIPDQDGTIQLVKLDLFIKKIHYN